MRNYRPVGCVAGGIGAGGSFEGVKMIPIFELGIRLRRGSGAGLRVAVDVVGDDGGCDGAKMMADFEPDRMSRLRDSGVPCGAGGEVSGADVKLKLADFEPGSSVPRAGTAGAVVLAACDSVATCSAAGNRPEFVLGVEPPPR